jgi:copper chaperone
MKTDQIMIANLKCHGCAATIIKELKQIDGVREVTVDIDSDTVAVGSDGVDRKAIITKLYSLGYPEATEDNGLLLQLKSYKSCVIGRINNH